MKITPYHPFRSEKAREKYLAFYDNRAELWPRDSESRTVYSSSGQTFIRVLGPADAPPLVLLPAASSTSLVWNPNIAAFSQSYRVYAVDNIYDFGRSVYKIPFKKTTDYMNWLTELFDELGLKSNINLIGYSYGGWLTCQYAMHAPQRLRKMVLLAPPATLFPLPAAWAWYGITALIPHRFFLRNMARWMLNVLAQRKDQASQNLFDDFVEEGFMGIRCFKLKMPVAPTVLSDKELQSIKTPALFLVGEREVVYPAQKAVQRLTQTAPHIKTAVVPDAAHDLTIVQTEYVNKKILEFMK